jgi:hypothetical protein
MGYEESGGMGLRMGERKSVGGEGWKEKEVSERLKSI